MLAALRPDELNVPLFLHVLGAALYVGVLVTALSILALGVRGEGAAAAGRPARAGFMTLLVAGIPTFLLMRIAGQWLYSKGYEPPEGVEDPTWLGIGYIVGDVGLLLLLITTLIAGLGARSLRKNPEKTGLARAATILVAILVIANLVAVWAMTAKPG